MSVLRWNCRGIGLPWNIQFLTDVIRQKKPTFAFLCETNGRQDKLEEVRRKIEYEGMFVVEPLGKSGGLVLFWKVKDQAKLRSFSRKHIDVETQVEDMGYWRLTVLYGEPDRTQTENLGFVKKSGEGFEPPLVRYW